VFSALPHGASAPWVARARAAGARVIDLSSDFRPGNGTHTGPVPYGLTELVRAQLPDAALVANPGCYPTAILIALAPLFVQELVAPAATVSITAASGVTGAGDSPPVRTSCSPQVAENFHAYAVGNAHRHLPEMRAMAAEFGGDAGSRLYAAPAARLARHTGHDHGPAAATAGRSPRAVAFDVWR
jgi:N-acetyl-gamma-glutamyl-phosphate reductase